MAFFGSGATDYDNDEGDDHFISITDMIVALFFIFIIMIMAFALNYKQAEATSREEYEGLVRDREIVRRERDLLIGERGDVERRERIVLVERDDLNQKLGRFFVDREDLDRNRERATVVRAQVERAKATASSVLDRTREAIGQFDVTTEKKRDLLDLIVRRVTSSDPGLGIQFDAANGVIRFADNVLFAVGQSVLSDAGREAAGRLADALASIMPCYAGEEARAAAGECAEGPKGVNLETVFIEGHTDSTGSEDLNWRLSAARAIETYAAITARRPELKRLRNARGQPMLGVSGYGPDRPIDLNDFAPNRRIDIRFVFDAPPTEEVKRIEQLLTGVVAE